MIKNVTIKIRRSLPPRIGQIADDDDDDDDYDHDDDNYDVDNDFH